MPLHVCREAGGVLDRVKEKEKARTRERKERKGRKYKKERREEVKRYWFQEDKASISGGVCYLN